MTKILNNITRTSKYNIKDAMEFKERINNQQIMDHEVLVSFDVVSLFASIPVEYDEETILGSSQFLHH